MKDPITKHSLNARKYPVGSVHVPLEDKLSNNTSIGSQPKMRGFFVSFIGRTKICRRINAINVSRKMMLTVSKDVEINECLASVEARAPLNTSIKAAKGPINGQLKLPIALPVDVVSQNTCCAWRQIKNGINEE